MMQIDEYTKGAALKQINIEDLKNITIPLPPLAEQYRIVYKIQELLPIVEQYSNTQLKLANLNSGIKQLLKKSILQEAIQGKLVSQDPDDESASTLLLRIKEEKLRLVKDEKLKKKDIVDSVIYKGDDNKYYETIVGRTNVIDSPYSFPSSWEIVRLQNICSLLDGERKRGRGICLDAKYLRGKSTGEYIQTGKFVRKGDNIILVDGENSGEVFSVPNDGYMGSTFKQLWISETLFVPYILECIKFYQDELRNSKKGAAIPHLNKDIFKNLLIGIPPLHEQKKIVEKINETNNIIGN